MKHIGNAVIEILKTVRINRSLYRKHSISNEVPLKQ